LRFFSPFSGFPGLFQSQPIAFQGQAAIRPLQKKSCQKHYRRFSVRSKMCHNRRVSERQFNPPPSGRDAAIVAEPFPALFRCASIHVRRDNRTASRRGVIIVSFVLCVLRQTFRLGQNACVSAPAGISDYE
jgi:hypothetical protein